MKNLQHLPTLLEIRQGLAAGDEQHAFENLSTLRTGGKPLSKDNAAVRRIFAQVQKQAAQLNQTPLPVLSFDAYRLFEETGDRLAYESVYFKEYTLRNTVNALDFLRTGSAESRRALENGLWALCDTYTWALPAHLPNHGMAVLNETGFSADAYRFYTSRTCPNDQLVDLFASMHAQDAAQMLYLFADSLSPIVVQRVRTEIRRRVLDPLLQLQDLFFWETCENNWAAVCAGSVGCAALYSIQDSTLLAPLLTRMCQAMEGFLAGFDEDGICEEGLDYWQYGFRHFVLFAELLRRRTAGTIDLLQLEKVQKIACFPQKAFLNGCAAVSFADSSQYMQLESSLLHYLHHHVPQAQVPADVCLSETLDKWFSYVCMTLEEYDPALMGGTGFADDTYLCPSAEWVICRQTAGKNHVGFAAKGGHNETSHNHNDAGSFIVEVNGKQLLADPGCGLYTRQYFDGTLRYTLIACGSHGHNLPIINGQTQKSGRSHRCEKTLLQNTSESVSFSGDLASAYALPELQKLERCLHFDKQTGTTVLKDSFTFNSCPQTLTERFVSFYPPRIENGTVILQDGQDRLVLQANIPGQFIQLHCEDFARHDSTETVPLWLIDYELPAANQTTFELTVQPK